MTRDCGGANGYIWASATELLTRAAAAQGSCLIKGSRSSSRALLSLPQGNSEIAHAAFSQQKMQDFKPRRVKGPPLNPDSKASSPEAQRMSARHTPPLWELPTGMEIRSGNKPWSPTYFWLLFNEKMFSKSNHAWIELLKKKKAAQQGWTFISLRKLKKKKKSKVEQHLSLVICNCFPLKVPALKVPASWEHPG